MNNQFEKMQKLAFGKSLNTREQLNESSLREKIKELVKSSVDEAKKKKKPEDVAPQEDVNIDLGINKPAAEPSIDTVTPTDGGMDINPNVKSIQDSLQKAYVSAKELGDEKLINQIGNTITMLVRTQVLDGGKNIAENTNLEEAGNIEDSANTRDLNDLKTKLRILTTEWLNKGFDKEDVKEYIANFIETI